MHRIVCVYKNCSKGAALARGDITKGYATYVRLVILLLMKLSLMNYHGNDIGIQSSEKNCRGKQRIMMIAKIAV